MNICLLTRALPCHQDGGLEHHTLTLAKYLARIGESVLILTTGHPKGKSCDYSYNNIQVVHLPGTIPATYNLEFFLKTMNEIKRHPEIDIVHAQGFAGLGYMFSKSAPLITTIHGTLVSETPLQYSRNLKDFWKYRKRLMIKPLYKQLIRRTDSILVDSKFSQEILSEEFHTNSHKISVVPLGIDIDLFKPMDKTTARQQWNISGDFVITTLGRITESKGYQVLIDAISKIKDIPIRLYIGGEGHYRGHLEKKVQDLGLDNITFMGKIPSESLPEFYNMGDVFVFPDLTAPAFGLVAVEAMACGTPVIASHAGAIPEVVSPGAGFLFPRGNSEQLSRLIRILFEEKAIRTQMRKHARLKALSMYDAKMMCEKVVSNYRNVLEKTR